MSHTVIKILHGLRLCPLNHVGLLQLSRTRGDLDIEAYIADICISVTRINHLGSLPQELIRSGIQFGSLLAPLLPPLLLPLFPVR